MKIKGHEEVGRPNAGDDPMDVSKESSRKQQKYGPREQVARLLGLRAPA